MNRTTLSDRGAGTGPAGPKSPWSCIAEVERLDASAAIGWALDYFHPRIAFASSFGAEDVVVIDLLMRRHPGARVLTLDTGRLPEETYVLMDRIRARYGIPIEVHFPDRERVETMVSAKGLQSFRLSVEDRKECCAIRKVEPLRRALSGLDAWITGLRRDQAPTRDGIRKLERDDAVSGLWKLSPIADWSHEQVWTYIRENELPYNELHDRGYPSIGCAPCTRAVHPWEDLRAGRWWWERPEQKECGLHSPPPAPAQTTGPSHLAQGGQPPASASWGLTRVAGRREDRGQLS
jgi:phosphoadenosine phosphosulfate reductase